MPCETIAWVLSINTVMDIAIIYYVILLFVDQRRIERRYEVLLGGYSSKLGSEA